MEGIKRRGAENETPKASRGLGMGGVDTRGVRVYPYPRVRVGSCKYLTLTGRVGSGTGTTSAGTGIPGFTRKEQNFSRFWSENLFISACFLNYL